jgi:hypothetical protein
MRILLVTAAIVAFAGADLARAESQPQSGQASPASPASVADLHRAERMAEQLRKRLETPNKKQASSWAHGGR